MISLPFQYNGNIGVGTNNRTQGVLTIQPVIPFNLSDDWLLVTRWVLPLINQPDPLGNSGSTFGLGDLNAAFFFSPSSKLTGFSDKLTWGFGPDVQVPTHTDALLGVDHRPGQGGDLDRRARILRRRADGRDEHESL